MDSSKSWEQNALVSELIQGLEIARKLKEDLNLPSSVDSRDSLLKRILSSYDNALLILRWNESMSNSQTMHQATNTSLLMEDAEGSHKDHHEPKHNSKKRKMMPKWTERVGVKMENGVLEDGYSWRKYGQKDILSAKYPRSYYRCTFRKTKGCCATKQVQRSEEEPTMFDITYRGIHTCKGSDGVLSNIKYQHAQDIPTFTGKTDNITAHPFASPSTSFGYIDNDPFLSTLSQTPLSESNYLVSPSSFVVHEFDGVSNKPGPESHVSAETSTTNSPIFDFNFSLDAVGIHENFPFNASGFLS